MTCSFFRSVLSETGPEPRKAVVYWLSEALALNVGAEGSRPDPNKTASDAFMVNLGVQLLKLSMPFVTDPAMFKAKVDGPALLADTAGAHRSDHFEALHETTK